MPYLNAEPCPTKTRAGVESHGDAPLKPDVVDSDEPSLIERTQVPNDYTINELPFQPKFQGIEKKTMAVLGYITVSIYLPNAAALSSDERNLGIKIDVEFQIVEYPACGYLLGRDTLKAYKAIIDEDSGHNNLPSNRSILPCPHYRMGLLKQNQDQSSNLRCKDSLYQSWRKKTPFQSSENWDDGMELITALLRKRSVPEGTYLTDEYSLVSKRILTLCFINPSNKVTDSSKDETVAMARQFRSEHPTLFGRAIIFNKSLKSLYCRSPSPSGRRSTRS